MSIHQAMKSVDAASATNPKAGDKHYLKDTQAWSVSNLLSLPESDNAWIIKGLLQPKGQMLLAAPPKSGKSLLASELALALAVPFNDNGVESEVRYLFGAGPQPDGLFPGLEICRPKPPQESWRVLFLSLEMRENEVSVRLRKQLGGLFPRISVPRLQKTDPEPDKLKFDLTHVFGLIGKNSSELNQDLQIVAIENGSGNRDEPSAPAGSAIPGKDFLPLRELIMEAKPDVVIYDTLIQMHNVNENDNVLMKAVMRMVRRVTVKRSEVVEGAIDPVAHIVLHHTRKETGKFRTALSPEIMRGAGAVHGVADLVMLARQDQYKPEVLEIHISSRNSSIPNFFLKRDRKALTHAWEEKKKVEHVTSVVRLRKLMLKVLRTAGPSGRRLSQKYLNDEMESESKNSGKPLRAGPATIQARFDELRDEGAIHVVKVKQSLKTNGKPRKNAILKWQKCWLRLGPGRDTNMRVVKVGKGARSRRKKPRPARKK